MPKITPYFLLLSHGQRTEENKGPSPGEEKEKNFLSHKENKNIRFNDNASHKKNPKHQLQ